MSEAKIIFIFNGMKTIIQCNKKEKIRNIMEKYGAKIKIDKNKVYLVYNGNKVNEELSFEELANEEDKKMNMMNIIIYEINNNTTIEEKKEKSKELIYHKEKENYIVGEIEIKEEDINKDIRIINSFEQSKRNKIQWKDKEDDYKYENEKEIKENCKIEINNKKIHLVIFINLKKKEKI